jgi:hypothetical protein
MCQLLQLKDSNSWRSTTINRNPYHTGLTETRFINGARGGRLCAWVAMGLINMLSDNVALVPGPSLTTYTHSRRVYVRVTTCRSKTKQVERMPYRSKEHLDSVHICIYYCYTKHIFRIHTGRSKGKKQWFPNRMSSKHAVQQYFTYLYVASLTAHGQLPIKLVSPARKIARR